MEQPRGPSGVKTSLANLAVLGGLVGVILLGLLVVLVVGGIADWAGRKVRMRNDWPTRTLRLPVDARERAPREAVGTFLRRAATGRLDDAYALTTAAFQARHPREAFAGHLSAHRLPRVAREVELSFELIRMEPAKGQEDRFRYLVRGPRFPKPLLQIDVVNEAGAWKIDRLEAPAAPEQP
jgi:hypothetical protein